MAFMHCRSALAGALIGMALGLAPIAAYADPVAADAQNVNAGSLSPGVSLGGTEAFTYVCGPYQFSGGARTCFATGPTREAITSTRISTPSPPLLIIGQTQGHSANLFGLDFWTNAYVRLSITHDGLVGIGTQAPSYPLDVEGDGDIQIAMRSTVAGGKTWTIQSSGKTVPGLTGTFQVVDRTKGKARLTIDDAGQVTVASIRITGGSDLAEPFATGTPLRPGSVVSIDAAHPGRLKLSGQAYDRAVAGVISGAGQIQPGLTLEQLAPAKIAGQQVSLSGRVFALADTSGGPIEPGDLLTSSAVPGDAMRAKDRRRAQGAIIGKAMTGLKSGQGMVLMLVSLQ